MPKTRSFYLCFQFAAYHEQKHWNSSLWHLLTRLVCSFVVEKLSNQQSNKAQSHRYVDLINSRGWKGVLLSYVSVFEWILKRCLTDSNNSCCYILVFRRAKHLQRFTKLNKPKTKNATKYSNLCLIFTFLHMLSFRCQHAHNHIANMQGYCRLFFMIVTRAQQSLMVIIIILINFIEPNGEIVGSCTWMMALWGFSVCCLRTLWHVARRHWESNPWPCGSQTTALPTDTQSPPKIWTSINVKIVQEEKSEDHQSYYSSSWGEHESWRCSTTVYAVVVEIFQSHASVSQSSSFQHWCV